MEIPIRICFIKIPHFVDMLSSDPQETTFNHFLDKWIEMRPALNITWITSDAVGALRDANSFAHDGCIGSIQRNESDFAGVITLNDYYGPNITAWSTLFTDTIIIGTMYAEKKFDAENDHPTRVLEFFHAYSYEHWLVTGFLFLLLTSLLTLNLKLRKINTKKAVSRSLQLIIGCAINQHGNCGLTRKGFTTNFLYTLMTLLSFFTGFFLTSMIKTEMVALDPPFTIQSYQDIIDYDIIPLWIREVGQHGVFEFGKERSIEKQIWDRAVERGLNQSLISANSLLAENPEPIIAKIRQLTEMIAAGLTRSLVSRLMTTNLCSLTRHAGTLTNINGFAHADPTAREDLRVMLGSTFTEQRIQNAVARAMMRKVEMGTFLQIILNRRTMFYIQTNEGHVADIEKCIANVIVMPENEIQSVPLKHYRDLYLLALCAFMFSFAITHYEKYFWKRRISRVRKMRKIKFKHSLSTPDQLERMATIIEEA